MNYLEGLNEQQKEAVLHTKGPILVVAGAGTGKTKTIVHRILHLVHSGVDPQAILAITFTNKAATEMRERVQALLPAQDGLPTLSTFHSLGVRILREHASVLGLNKYFTILDSQDVKSLIKQAMNELDIDTKMWDPGTIAGVISRAKGDKYTPDTFPITAHPLTAITQSIWIRYEQRKREAQSLDFDDLLVETYRLLSNNEAILSSYQERWQYVHVDEYQDTNTIQYELVRLLVKKHKNLCAVGDGDQNIYSWRGADMKNILNFEKDFPNAKVVLLETNYRSTGTILEVAHEIISKNTERIEKKLVTNNPVGEKVALYQAFSEHQEASWVANQIQEYIKNGVEPKDIAVLFRTNFQSRVIEEALLYRALPYRVVGVKFFARKEIKDVMAYLRASLNPESLGDLKRIINEPKRGLGKVAMAKIFSGKANELTGASAVSYQNFVSLLERIRSFAEDHVPSETVKFIIQETKFQQLLSAGSTDDHERLENMKELVTYAKKYDDAEDPLTLFLEEVALLSDQDSIGAKEGENNAVTLMTIHASKGLEFAYVFVVGLEHGLFPSVRDGQQTKHESEEERRLCYVAFTRAKDKLHCSYAQLRTIYGQQRMNEPSIFLKDIPDALFEEVGDGGDDEVITSYLDF